MNKNIKYSYSCYRYAPESFSASVTIGNITKKFELDYDEKSTLGQLAICKGSKATIDELKRIHRKQYKKKNYNVCYGVYELENNKRYHYIGQLTANKYNIQQKLYIYKEVKKYFESLNWEIKEGKKAILGADFKAEKVEEITTKLNKNRFVELTII